MRQAKSDGFGFGTRAESETVVILPQSDSYQRWFWLLVGFGDEAVRGGQFVGTCFSVEHLFANSLMNISMFRYLQREGLRSRVNSPAFISPLRAPKQCR